MKILVISFVGLLILSSMSCSVESTSQEQHNHEAHVNESKTADLMLTDSQIQLANIRTQKVMYRQMTEPRVITARLIPNSNGSEVISSRVNGRLDRLFAKETGKIVKQGEPLYEIYSEGLLTLQQEFLVARDQASALGDKNPRYKSFADGARKKLNLYGLTEVQIDELSRTGRTQPRITFIAPATGVIRSIEVQEGQYVTEGTALYKIEDLNSLWVEADLFAEEANLVKVGDRVKVKIERFPVVEVVVDFISPEFKEGVQTWIMRGSISNQRNLKPGMPAQVWINRSNNETIALPVQAVIRSEAGAYVYVETDKNTFQPRRVKTGLENFEEVEILEGLTENETVAVSGAYLIYSEYILKQGINPIEHKH